MIDKMIQDLDIDTRIKEADHVLKVCQLYGVQSLISDLRKIIKIAEKYKAKEPRWIPVEERLPEEEDILGKKMSDMVCVACESEKGKHIISASHTNDGEWTIEKMLGFKVIAWMQLPEYEEGGAE